MAMHPERLQVTDLTRFRVALERTGCPVEFPDGTPRGLMLARCDELGLNLPDELVVWFSWSDLDTGVVPLMPGFYPGPFNFALSEWLFFGELLREVATDEHADEVWTPAWLPIGTDAAGGYMLVDISGRADAPARVTLFDWHQSDQMLDIAPSLGLVVRGWTTALETGAYAWDAADQRWAFHSGRIPEGTDVWYDTGE